MKENEPVTENNFAIFDAGTYFYEEIIRLLTTTIVADQDRGAVARVAPSQYL